MVDMSSTEPTSDVEHPLFADRDLLNEVRDVMYAKIHTVLRWQNPGLATGSGPAAGAGQTERTLIGTGTSADDILADAMEALLTYPPDRLTHTWQALSVQIARFKAIEALRKAEKGRRGTEHRRQLRLVSGDHRPVGADSEESPSVLEALPDEWQSLDEEYLALRAVLDLRDLARELLAGRQLDVYLRIHFLGELTAELAAHYGLTPRRIRQIYNDAQDRLDADPRNPYTNHDETGGRQ
jgi:DNA-directed RNA polymerase specialized sigma24 family protein